MFGICLEGIWKLSRGCMAGVQLLSGGCLEGVWRVPGGFQTVFVGCLDGVLTAS